MREEGLLAGETTPEEAAFEAGIRPQSLDEFVGQSELKERRKRTRDKLRKLLRDGKLETKEIDIEVTQSNFPVIEFPGMEGMDYNVSEMLQDMMPKKSKRYRQQYQEKTLA